MILSKSYKEIMEKIEISDEMRNRILTNISKEAFTPKKKTLPFRKWKTLTSIAACIAVLIICGTVIPHLFHKNPNTPDEFVTGPTAEIESFNSAKELSQKSGFMIQDISNLPFKPDSISYTLLWNELAEIEYDTANQQLIYRKAAETGNDISGDYNDYSQTHTEKINDIDITFKGQDDLCYLATWSFDGYSYSLNANPGISYDDMQEMIISIENQ